MLCQNILRPVFNGFQAMQNPSDLPAVRPSLEDRLVRRIYELRMMTVNGEYAPDAGAMSPSALYTCQYIMGAPMEKLYTFTVKPEVLEELEKLMNRHMKKVLDRKIRSLEILESFL